MPCKVVTYSGGTAIVCSRGSKQPKRCYVCNVPTDLLCDGQKEGGKTCDRPVCQKHSRHVAYNTDVCLECLSDSHVKGMV